MDFINDYGLFLAKTFTVVCSIAVILGLSFSLKMRYKQKEGQVSITDLSKQLETTRLSLQLATTNKNELKKLKYNYKQRHKQSALEHKPRLFVLRFAGDIAASQTAALRECVTAILLIAKEHDEVLLILESSGGQVHSYGLAAAQLQRVRDNNLSLTVAVDKIAASGGYMMAAVAHKIIASPFAIIGSIGVVANVPNLNRWLQKHSIDFQEITAGKYKRTVSLLGKNTDEGEAKFREELEAIHTLFKDHIHKLRPSVDIETVATGEHWHALLAKQYNLIDELLVSDDYILNKNSTYHVFEVKYIPKQTISNKIKQLVHSTIHEVSANLSNTWHL